MLGLYVHIPFCAAICNYCNFNRGLFDADRKARYVQALLRDIARAGETRERGSDAGQPPLRERADTIYFGGGTPSLLEPEEVGRIVEACESAFDVAADREVTLEANPETVSASRLAGFRAAGVGRLSFGVQSLRDDELRRLTRLHGAERAREAVGEARVAGFDNISLDLMMWLPGQSVNQWLESVDGAIELGPEHLSLYLLEVYPNSPLKEEMARARWSQAGDEDAATMYETAMERLEASGYEQYEISNVARRGRQSRHNLKYWADGEWLGFGCGAHSTRRGVRWRNVSGIDEYINRIGQDADTSAETNHLSWEERLGDALFTGLRLRDGVSESAVQQRYGVDVWARYGRELAPFVADGLLERRDGWLRLTRRGMLLAHEVMAVFV